MRHLKMNLTGKLIAEFLLIALVPLALVSAIGFSIIRTALLNSAFEARAKDRILKTAWILQYLGDRMANLGVLGGSETAAAVEQLRAAGTAAGRWSARSDAYQAAYDRVDPRLRGFAVANGFVDVALVDAAGGRLLYTSAHREDLEAGPGPMEGSGLTGIVALVTAAQKPTLADYAVSEASGAPAAYMGAPVRDQRGVMVAVLAAQLDDSAIQALMDSGRLNDTSECQLIGDDEIMRSNSRLVGEPTILSRRVSTAAVEGALKGTSGTAVLKDSRGVMALMSFGPVGLPAAFATAFDWIMVSKIDEQETMIDVRRLALAVAVIAAVVAAIVVAAGLIAARRMARPIKEVARQAALVGAGDLTVQIPVSGRSDEIGTLTRVFAEVVRNLSKQTRQIQEASGVLASSSTEISTTVAQLAASITETTGSVNETTTTMEELRQTTRVATDKAQAIALDTQQTSDVSQSGIAAVEETLQHIERIGRQMGVITDAITRLNEQGQAIGEIIATVNDFAGQSNLLAVNAAIEAARAGDEGKGFAVVADEIRRLAEQSRQATQQVQGILHEVQRGVAAAVLAAEQGTRIVEAGTQQARQTGDALHALAGSIERTAQAVSQISASSQEMTVGVGQVTEAMGSIQQSSEQNAQGAGQLEAAARNLRELGIELQELVGALKA